MRAHWEARLAGPQHSSQRSSPSHKHFLNGTGSVFSSVWCVTTSGVRRPEHPLRHTDPTCPWGDVGSHGVFTGYVPPPASIPVEGKVRRSQPRVSTLPLSGRGDGMDEGPGT